MCPRTLSGPRRRTVLLFAEAIVGIILGKKMGIEYMNKDAEFANEQLKTPRILVFGILDKLPQS